MRVLPARVLPRRTVRMRLTILYGVLFVVSGAVLLAITSGVVVSSSRVSAVVANQAALSPLTRDQIRIHELQAELAAAESQIHSGVSHGLLVGSAIALGIMTVISAVLGWIVAGRVLRPLLRIRALARRQPAVRSRTLRAAGIELDPLRRTVVREGRQLDLSVKEFAVLEALLRATPAFLSAEDLLEQVWDEQADPFTNTVTVTIGRLRRKLGDPPVITTTPGVGYRIGTRGGPG